jgi:hypothetical protein
MERLRKKKNSGVKVRKKNGQKWDSSVPGSDVTRRQRLDLKGPRVKHVCRSASIVLGQPQATFPLDKRVDKIQVKLIQGKDTNMYINYFRLVTSSTLKMETLPRYWYLSVRFHSVTSQKAIILIF